jgi:ubiquinone/menaquinone biosynthesis C-methylase UbiE/DNA-binding transcriptional ArsR family regulator
MVTDDPELSIVVGALKSVAEPTRLRLLALLRHGELTVGELCQILGQSQPRVSRHLRLLAEAGFLDRFREQQCVYYRAPASGARLEWLRELLRHTDDAKPALLRDEQRMNQVVAERGLAAEQQLSQLPEVVGSGNSHLQLAAVLHEEMGAAEVGALLVIGTGGGRMLQILAPRATQALGLDHSAAALRLARARLHGAGLSHCEFRRADLYALPCEDDSFDTVSMDRVLATAERPGAAVAEAARALRGDGRLIIVEHFDQLQSMLGGYPLQLLGAWLSASGLTPVRLRCCELDDGRYIVALARHSAAGLAAAESA